MGSNDGVSRTRHALRTDVIGTPHEYYLHFFQPMMPQFDIGVKLRGMWLLSCDASGEDELLLDLPVECKFVGMVSHLLQSGARIEELPAEMLEPKDGKMRVAKVDTPHGFR